MQHRFRSAAFRLLAQNSREIKVLPLQEFYPDIRGAAQRAIYGFVFIDKDSDGKYNPQKDEPVEGTTAIVRIATRLLKQKDIFDKSFDRIFIR